MDYAHLFAHLEAIWYDEIRSIGRNFLQMKFSDFI